MTEQMEMDVTAVNGATAGAVMPKKRRSDAGVPRKNPEAPAAAAGGITPVQAEHLKRRARELFELREEAGAVNDRLMQAEADFDKLIDSLTRAV